MLVVLLTLACIFGSPACLPAWGHETRGAAKDASLQASPEGASARQGTREAGTVQDEKTASSPAFGLKARAKDIAAVILRDCAGRKLAAMSPAEIQAFKSALVHARLAEGASAVTPPWEALLEIDFSTGLPAYAQLVNEGTLRVGASSACKDYRPKPTARRELILQEGRLDLYAWIEKRLGKTKDKEHSLPKGMTFP